MSAAEIIAELPRLSLAELAEVEAKVRELIGRSPAVGDQTNSRSASHPPRIHSPRLAHPERAKDFVKAGRDYMIRKLLSGCQAMGP
jgi:hypothetical protein